VETLKEHLKRAERDYLIELMQESRGKVVVAMQIAGYSQNSESRFRKKYYAHGIKAKLYRKYGQ
jgi:hypothetical protein